MPETSFKEWSAFGEDRAHKEVGFSRIEQQIRVRFVMSGGVALSMLKRCPGREAVEVLTPLLPKAKEMARTRP